MIIDFHAHLVPDGFMEDLRAGRFAPSVTVEQGTGRPPSVVNIEEGENWEVMVAKGVGLDPSNETRNPLTRHALDVDTRLDHMENTGVDKQILSAITAMTFYTLDAGLNREIAASLNDGLADIANRMPGKFHCMAGVPLQDPPAAAAELERAVGLGHVGVKIGSNVAGTNLDDPGLDVFWDKAVSLDVPIFIHPGDIIGAKDRMKDYHLNNLLANPLDTTIAVACLIFGGVFDRFPDLKIILAHLGGFTPWIRGRLQQGHIERDEPKARGSKAPENYIGNFYFDTVIHNADCLEFAVKTLGAEKILYGTDCPWNIGNLGPAKDIPGLSRLSKEDQEKILVGNAKRLYKL
ncbi:amidohydrolase family protein [Nitrospinota bacterium]